MEPPPYTEASNIQESPLLPPTTLQINGRLIYAQHGTAPIYELSHEVRHLRDTTRSVAINKLESTIKTHRSGTSDMVTHPRHIYDLRHPGILTGPLFLYHAESTSRQSLCPFGMSTFRPKRFSSASGFRVHRATKMMNNQMVARQELFSAVSSKVGGVTFEWSDPNGEILARELGQEMLFITRDMESKMRDALVSAWVLRLWWERAGSVMYEL